MNTDRIMGWVALVALAYFFAVKAGHANGPSVAYRGYLAGQYRAGVEPKIWHLPLSRQHRAWVRAGRRTAGVGQPVSDTQTSRSDTSDTVSVPMSDPVGEGRGEEEASPATPPHLRRDAMGRRTAQTVKVEGGRYGGYLVPAARLEEAHEASRQREEREQRAARRAWVMEQLAAEQPRDQIATDGAARWQCATRTIERDIDKARQRASRARQAQ